MFLFSSQEKDRVRASCCEFAPKRKEKEHGEVLDTKAEDTLAEEASVLFSIS